MPRILYTVLDWGLGHATRSIPMIRRLLNRGAEVLLAGEGASLKLLKDSFPQLESARLKGIQIRYPEKGSMAAAMWNQRQSIKASIADEHRETEKLIVARGIHAIISDHRYGVWSERIPSVLIAHQLHIKSPFFHFLTEPLLFRLHLPYLRVFSEVWIPDLPDEANLSGSLSHEPRVKKKLKVRFIGPLSRLAEVHPVRSTIRYDLLGICSGPEPARGRLERLLRDSFLRDGRPALLVKGQPMENRAEKNANVYEVPNLTAGELRFHIEQAQTVISRSGYSTLMDLYALGRCAIVLPTPGQTEQEYLAQYHRKSGWLVTEDEHNFDLGRAESLLRSCKPFTVNTNTLADNAVDDLLNRL